MALVRTPSSAATIGISSAMPRSAPAPRVMPPALPLLSPVPAGGAYMRRCTFRRVELVGAPVRRTEPSYSVSCLYPDGESGRPLGDLQSARAICHGCAATGIFRPDED